MYLVIGADIVPTSSNMALFKDGDKEALAGDGLCALLDQAAFRIFNLEVPLTDRETPIEKNGPNLIAETAAIAGYKALGVDLLTLANNHIFDQGIQGLNATVSVLNKAGIKHVGVGENLEEASKPFLFQFNEKTVGLYACVEHEFSIAGEKKAGANPFDPLWSFDHVEQLKKASDYVIVLYHGGKEHYRYPSPELQRICRRFVDKGADLVICQHSHCIGCEEKYAGGTIVYGQGNFIFDDGEDECWETSLLVRLDDDFAVSYVPLRKAENGVRLAEGNDSHDILREFNKRSDEIKTPGFIKENYARFAKEFTDFYLNAFSGRHSLAFRIMNRITKGKYKTRYLQKAYKPLNKTVITNYIDCEAHRELLLEGLSNSSKGDSI